MRFVPGADWNGSVANALTFKGWDRSTGTAGGTADASTGGGTSAFSAASASSAVTVTAVNDAPVAHAGNATVGRGATLAGTVNVSDVDLPADTLTVTLVSGPAHGTLVLNVDGSYSYTHDGTANYSDSFTYAVTDAAGASSQASVALTITRAPNHAPVAQSGAVTVAEGGSISGDVTASDADLPLDTLTYALVNGPAHGTLVFGADGTYSYTHDGSEGSTDSFSFEVSDETGATSHASVAIAVTPVNDNAPVAQAGAATLAEGGSVTESLVASDTDLPNDVLTYALVSGPTHGVLTVQADGTYSYTHDGSENFADAFIYSVTDANGATAQATVTLTITPVNDNTPIAQAGTATLVVGGSVTGTVIATDADLPNDDLMYAVVSGPSHGALTFNADGTYSYTHDGSESFADGFTFKVTDANGASSQAAVALTITPVNDNAPIAQAGTATLAEGGSVTGARRRRRCRSAER